MKRKININPVTRVSGFLEIEVLVENNKVIDAKSSGHLFRGFEDMLKGRPPLDVTYFTERICGICSTAHSMGSTLALEDALQIVPRENDKMIRDFIHGCEFLQNDLRHTYQYSFPDYVQGPKIPPLDDTMQGDYRLPSAVNDRLADHYLQSTKYSRLAHEMLAELGGKAPHNHGIFVGGVTVNIDADKWIKVKYILDSIQDFIKNVMFDDIYTIAQYYPDYFHNGQGYKNMMSYGLFDDYTDPELFYVRPQIYKEGDLLEFNVEKITENIRYAWYKGDKDQYQPNLDTVEADRLKEAAYSWIKAPRYANLPMEVGPLARMWLSGNYKNGISTMDRLIARVLEVRKVAEIMKNLLERIELKATAQKQYKIPDKAEGKGLIGTTRGALGHWLAIENQKIAHYEIITPTAWNLSPQDNKKQRGVIEQALVGTEIMNLNNPVEIGRIVRSFDPCVSCATHVISDKFSPITIRIN